MTNSEYSIRQFDAADVLQYKAIRLEALQKEPGVFGNSYALEAAFTDEQWLKRVTNTDSACFGLYCDDELAGITAVLFSNKERPDEAYMTQSYIREAHRGRGLSAMLYEVRLQWAKTHDIKRLVIGHKRSNTTSFRANQRFGFIYTHSMPRHWPDGSIEDMLYYELILNGNADYSSNKYTQ